MSVSEGVEVRLIEAGKPGSGMPEPGPPVGRAQGPAVRSGEHPQPILHAKVNSEFINEELRQAKGAPRRWRLRRADTHRAADLAERALYCELATQQIQRLMNLASDALGVVEGSIGQGDARTALALLRGVGLLSGQPQPIGPLEPEQIRTQQALKEKSLELDEFFARL